MLVTRPPGYALEIDPDALDLVRFERVCKERRPREALALWHGPALAEFAEPFAAGESTRLGELHLAALEDRIDADLAASRHARLVGELEALVARNPLRERVRAQLMLARYRSGRQPEALAGALRDLERRVLQQDPALDLALAERPHRRVVGQRGIRPGAARASRRRLCALTTS
jgi:DNA-binding SARP family transcriptional activator